MYIPVSMLQLLVPLYNSPQRHYHNMNHINFCISKMSEVLSQPDYREIANDKVSSMILLLAIYFHDAIYSPYPQIWSNEDQSSDLFTSYMNVHIDEFLNAYDFEAEELTTIVEAVNECILATQYHLKNIDDMDYNYKELVEIMLDIDLSGFARSFKEFYKDSEKIFKEYEALGLSEQDMLKNRIAFFEKMLSKEKIYYTDYFHSTHENTARNNLEAVIEVSKANLDK